MMDIHIEWDGPYDLESIKNLSSSKDYGVYQVYGTHPVYGSDVLLYIGQACGQNFSTRIPQHDKWLDNQDSKGLSVYVGRLGGNTTISTDDWDKQIDIAEKLLIFSHKPALNSSSINSTDEKKIPIDTHVYNWLNHKNILPEISAFRYFADDEKYFKNYQTYCDE